MVKIHSKNFIEDFISKKILQILSKMHDKLFKEENKLIKKRDKFLEKWRL